MCDSTWHCVGDKNVHFTLAVRKTHNGVKIASKDGDSGISNIQNNTFLCSPTCRRLENENFFRSEIPADAEKQVQKHADARVAAGPCEGTYFEILASARLGGLKGRGGASAPIRARATGHSNSRIDNSINNSNNNVTSFGFGEKSRRGGGGRSIAKVRKGGVVADSFAEKQGSYRMKLSLSAEERGWDKAVAARAGPREQHAGGVGGSLAKKGGEEVVSVRCCRDNRCDMYQLGRMKGSENYFAVRGPMDQTTPGGKGWGPMSRYALRVLVDRAYPHRCQIFAGGFNTR